MERYNVYVPYYDVALIEVDANTEEEAIEKAKKGDSIASDIIPETAEQLWSEAWCGA